MPVRHRVAPTPQAARRLPAQLPPVGRQDRRIHVVDLAIRVEIALFPRGPCRHQPMCARIDASVSSTDAVVVGVARTTNSSAPISTVP